MIDDVQAFSLSLSPSVRARSTSFCIPPLLIRDCKRIIDIYPNFSTSGNSHLSNKMIKWDSLLNTVKWYNNIEMCISRLVHINSNGGNSKFVARTRA